MKKEILFFFLLLSSCTGSMSDEIAQRVDILYEHTILMEEYSTPQMLEEIGLDVALITNSPDLSHEDKLTEMAAAYGMEVQGNPERKLLLLEGRMNEMMEQWALLQ